jgi:hypothetical protein
MSLKDFFGSKIFITEHAIYQFAHRILNTIKFKRKEIIEMIKRSIFLNRIDWYKKAITIKFKIDNCIFSVVLVKKNIVTIY